MHLDTRIIANGKVRNAKNRYPPINYLTSYLGIHINDKLQWSSQCQFAASKATGVLNVLRRTMLGCDSEAI